MSAANASKLPLLLLGLSVAVSLMGLIGSFRMFGSDHFLGFLPEAYWRGAIQLTVWAIAIKLLGKSNGAHASYSRPA